MTITTSTGDTWLKTPGSILDAQDETGGALLNISGRGIILTAIGGTIGVLGNALEIDSANGGTGNVYATSLSDIFLTETNGDLSLGNVQNTNARVFLVGPGSILNGIGRSSGFNIDAASLAFTAGTSTTSNVGSASAPILTRISRLAGTAGGSVWLENTGALTVGQITGDGSEINVGIDINLTAHSPITIEGHLHSGGGQIIRAMDKAAAGDDITICSTAVITAGVDIILLAGDRIDLQVDSSITAGNELVLFGDYSGGGTGNGDYNNALDPDIGTGTAIIIRDTILAKSIRIYGGNDSDTFEITVTTLSSTVNLYGKAGNDSITINQLPSLTSEHNSIRDTVTLDGQDGEDTYTININGASDCSHIINIFDSGADVHDEELTTGVDRLNINGTTSDDTLLLRQKFIAVLHALSAEDMLTMLTNLSASIMTTASSC